MVQDCVGVAWLTERGGMVAYFQQRDGKIGTYSHLLCVSSRKGTSCLCGTFVFIAREPFFVSSRTRNVVEWRDLPASGKGQGMKAFPLGVSRALCASPRCGVRAQRTEVFAIVGKNRDRRRRRSLRRRDRYHEVTDEGSSRAAVPLPSPSSPPSAELLPGEKPLRDAERGGAGGL